MDAIARDLRYALRMLAAAPGFLAAAVLTLALGIALACAVFSLVDGLVLRPLPVAAPEELVAVFTSVPGEYMSHAPLATAEYLDLSAGARSLAEAVAYTYTPLALEHGGDSRLVLGERVTANYFSFLGVDAELGRVFDAGEIAASGGSVAVLAHTAWRRRYGADPRVIGATLAVNGRPTTVIGVAPEGFTGLTRGFSPELWTPLDLAGAERGDRRFRWLWVVGRLAAGFTAAEARAEIGLMAAGWRRDLPAIYDRRDLVALPKSRVRILPGVDTRLVTASSVALAGAGLVLAIAGANVANMLLARAAGRRGEIATRLALGASGAAVARQLAMESLVVALLGGAAGLAGAVAAHRTVAAIRLPVAVDLALGPALDTRALVFALGTTLLVAVVFGLAPILDAARTDLAAVLRPGSDGAPGGRPKHGWRGALVVAQVALSLLLLISAGLALASWRNASRIDPGFDSKGVIVASFAPRLQGYSEGRTRELYRRLVERVRRLPGIEAAGLASHLPLTVEVTFENVAAAGRESAAPEEWPRIDAATVGPGYFAAMRVPLVAGRTFRDGDTEETPPVAVVNEALVRSFWPGSTAVEAVGRRLRVRGVEEVCEVAGVVADGKYRTLGEPARPFLYLTFDQGRWRREGKGGEISSGTETLVARTAGPPAAALAALRGVARELDSQLAVSRLATLERALGPVLSLPRLVAGFFAVFGLLALALATAGTYAVVAYSTSRRTREIGIRMALGARYRDVLRLVLRDALALTALGVALGLAGAFAATRALAAFLYGVSATDAATFVAVPLTLAVVALAAAYLPARRAARIDPLAALRWE